MNKITVYSINGDKKEDIEISNAISDLKMNKSLLYYTIIQHLNNKRRGTACAKTRGEVSGGGKKPWKQKGTGRARQGSIRAPHWRGGGTTFGPRPKNFKYEMPKQAKTKALNMVIADKIKNNNLIVLNELKLTKQKTNKFAEMLGKFNIINEKVLIVYDGESNISKASRNIKNVKLLNISSLNAYSIINSDKLLTTKDIFLKITQGS